MRQVSRSSAVVEIAAMTALLLTFIWGWHDAFPGAFLAVVAGYFGIGLVSHLRRGETAREIGLRIDNWRVSARSASGVVAASMVAPLAVGGALGSWRFADVNTSASALLMLFLWATAQQYGLLCFFFRRLQEILRSPTAASLAAAGLFALFHLPNPFLTAATLVAGLIACMLYRRGTSVFVIGAAHAAVSFTLYGALPLSVTHGLRVGPGYYAFG